MKQGDEGLGLTFARSLPLRRINLSQTLSRIVDSDGNSVSYKDIWATSDLGSIEAQASKRWLKGFDAVDSDDNITGFGRLLLDYDIALSFLTTQWLLHYHFVCPHRGGPTFWRWIWAELMFSQGTFTKDSVFEVVRTNSLNSGEKKLSDDTYEIAARSFINAYTSVDGLGQLEILHEEPPHGYRSGPPAEISWRVMAYILADFWEANWGQTLSVPLAQINGDNGPALLMLLNSGQMNQLMKPMQEAGLVEISRVTRPWTVVRKWPGKEALLEAVYADVTP